MAKGKLPKDSLAGLDLLGFGVVGDGSTRVGDAKPGRLAEAKIGAKDPAPNDRAKKYRRLATSKIGGKDASL